MRVPTTTKIVTVSAKTETVSVSMLNQDKYTVDFTSQLSGEPSEAVLGNAIIGGGIYRVALCGINSVVRILHASNVIDNSGGALDAIDGCYTPVNITGALLIISTWAYSNSTKSVTVNCRGRNNFITSGNIAVYFTTSDHKFPTIANAMLHLTNTEYIGYSTSAYTINDLQFSYGWGGDSARYHRAVVQNNGANIKVDYYQWMNYNGSLPISTYAGDANIHLSTTSYYEDVSITVNANTISNVVAHPSGNVRSVSNISVNQESKTISCTCRTNLRRSGTIYFTYDDTESEQIYKLKFNGSPIEKVKLNGEIIPPK